MFAAVFGVLVFRNRFLFTTPLYELGDSGANSIIIGQAKHFGLLVGNYSRQGFSHPGPAYFYLQAAGEAGFHDLLGLVPTPWNGQLLAIYAMNAALLTVIAFIMASHFRAGWAILLLAGLIAWHPGILTDAWMPFVYVLSFLLLLVASASVAAGRAEHLWAVALSGGLLIHGHVVFLLFVPVVAGCALAWLRYRHGFDRRAWAIAAGVFAVFLIPLALNTFLHWPGEFGKYFGYGSSDSAGSHSVTSSLGYVLWYWWPFATPVIAGVFVVTAIAVATAFVREPFVRAGLCLCGLVTLLLAFYAYAGIDDLSHPYMGYFYWSVPIFMLAAPLAWLAERLPAPRYHAPLLATVLVLALVPGVRSGVGDNYPSVPQTLHALKTHAAGHPLVIEIADPYIGPEVTGLLYWAHRDGFRACLRDPKWRFIATADFICTPTEVAEGVVISRWEAAKDSLPRPGEIARTGTSAFVAAPAKGNT
ncbi:hypothetical protein Rhe02_27920 [Rhizocola hellebori]|uniref:Uncharacterized protein n=1 Tax=Rhizocola hellebori TaxID=1392758 RepID=A0A8J3Q6H6_9ACTN|nr:hypothetical protein Rhe02_27920 [Rhizocola hellebori]